MSAVLQDAQQSIRWVRAQEAWDNRSEPEPECDEFADRRAAIEMCREELDRAVRYLNSGHLMLADQAMADAAGFIV